MENTNDEADKNFVSHNSNKPFIRTMDDDLKKIKNSPARNGRAASAIFSDIDSYGSNGANRANVFHEEIKHPVFASDPASISAAASLPPIPKNLPVDMPIVKKEKPGLEAKKEIFKTIEKPKGAIDFNKPDSRIISKPDRFERELSDEKKSALDAILAAGGEGKITPASRPITPVWRKPVEETEKLPPEARLARQLSSGVNGEEIGPKENLAAPPPARISSIAPAQSGNFTKPFNPIPPVPSSPEEKKRSIEEIIKEDSTGSYLGKFVKIFFAVLIIIGIAIGAYYIYTMKKPVVNPVSTGIPSETFISGVTEVTIKADLNTDLNSEIKSYFSDAKPSGIYRLIIKDKDGKNSLGLENFRKNLNIFLPDSIANALEKDYNLIVFNYPEKNYLRLGLALRPKNSFDISILAKNWESDMYRSTGAIFLGNSGVYDQGKQFGANKYNNFDIRYLPLGSENIALNYAIDSGKKFLLIATSKQDIFNLIDKIIKGK